MEVTTAAIPIIAAAVALIASLFIGSMGKAGRECDLCDEPLDEDGICPKCKTKWEKPNE